MLEPVWFRYDVTAEKPRVAYPDEPLMRPTLETVILARGGAPVTTRLLVDSGSEYTLVTRAFARRLGIAHELSRDRAESILMGGQTLSAELVEVGLEIPPFEPVEIVMGFVGNWTFPHSGVLGQRGFFDRFGVLFDRVNLRFGLVVRDALGNEFGTPVANEGV